METELQVLVARLSTQRWLPRRDALVKRALTDELFRNGLDERLAACGLELVEHPYADNVALRIRRELEQPVFGGADVWLSNNLDLKRDQIALLVVVWSLLVLPKRQKQIERRNTRSAERQNEMFAVEKPVPSTAELNISLAEATLIADFGDRLGGKTRIGIALGVLSRLGFIERRDGRIYEGPLLDLVLDYNRMARRVLDGTLADLFGTHIENIIDETPSAPDIEAPSDEEEVAGAEEVAAGEDAFRLPVAGADASPAPAESPDARPLPAAPDSLAHAEKGSRATESGSEGDVIVDHGNHSAHTDSQDPNTNESDTNVQLP
jgi:hypothetical protein